MSPDLQFGTGEVYLDAENIFHGFLTARRDRGADLIQSALYSPPTEAHAANNAVARMRRILGSLIQWFERESGCFISNIISAGKAEPTVRTFLYAVSDPRDSERAYQYQQDLPWRTHEFCIGERIRVSHTTVDDRKDAADHLLISRFNERLPHVKGETPFLVGSGDDLVISRFDLALGERGDPDTTDAVIDVWAVLPLHEDLDHRWDVLDKFGRPGVYPHIPRDNVRFLAQFAVPEFGMVQQLFGVRRREQDDVRRTLLEAADEAAEIGAGATVSHEVVAASDAAAPLANLLALRVELLDGAKPGDPGWRATLGDPWTHEAVAQNVSRVISSKEYVKFYNGDIAPRRLLEIVWRCAVLRVIEDEADFTAARLRAFATVLDQARPSWRWKEALAALIVLEGMHLV